MNGLKFAVILIAVIVGGWMGFDGTRAFVTGDYVTPKAGPNAGQLGPWAKVISALGLNPRSTVIKSLHVVLGCVWLIAATLLPVRPQLGWYGLFASSVLSLWYLPLGTVLSLLELSLLFWSPIKSLR